MQSDIDKKLISALDDLPEGYWDFKEADTKEFTHGIHNYPAMMVSPISRNIIRLMKKIKKIDALFDPFAGSGTVLVEGMLAGIPVVAGNDINPLALFLTRAKTNVIDGNELDRQTRKLQKTLFGVFQEFSSALDSVDQFIASKGLDVTAKDGWGENAPAFLAEFCSLKKIELEIPDFKNIGYWFKPPVIIALSLIKSEISKIQDEQIRRFFFVAFSEAIRFVSNRRNGEFKMFRMPAEKVRSFNPDVLVEFLRILNRNTGKMRDFQARLSHFSHQSEVSVFDNNVCDLHDVPDSSFDLIITSPPYGDSRTTVAYGEFSRLSLQWIDLFNLSAKEIMGVDRSLMGGEKFKKGFSSAIKSETLQESLLTISAADQERAGDVYSFYKDLDSAIKNISCKTRSGGYQFWVVGNRTVKGELLKTDVIITEIGKEYDLEWIYTIDRNIPNKVMPSLNSPTNESGKKSSTMTMEHIVVLKKK